ncbi:ribonuclease H-like domain-containing protein [Demequina globuliformis]|uniref:ribonuclease H-like domain-containing protein n=1 Tax=Demequina globuliformis TaxID=676202 RepID=UPI001379165C|nr:ribonuclease H-like domain-containing protein [Demequina globuliformis]
MTTRAKVLTFDIERRPGVYLSWGPRVKYMGREKQLIRSSTISFAAKWYGDPDVTYRAIDPVDSMFMQPEDVPGYRDMLVSIRDLMDQADIVVGYNSIRFDEAKLRGEFARMGIPEPSPYRSLDLMRTSKRMGWDYASLAETLDAFGLGGKVAHQGFALWTDFLRGDTEAHALMEEYNIGDVIQTERAMDAMRPWIKDHPNLNLWAGHDESGNPVEVCCNCGKSELALVEGRSAMTALTNYALVKCKACGAFQRRNFVKARTLLRTVR